MFDKCAMPVFEELLPEPYNGHVLDLLFTLMYWHALAKLRMHTDSSISLLKACTMQLGTEIRRFVRRVCPFFATREMPHQAEARRKRKLKKQVGHTRPASKSSAKSAPESEPWKRKNVNLLTYKLHALGDYVAQILWFGTTDSYSTQRVRNILLLQPCGSDTVFCRESSSIDV